jgi:ribosomal protein L16/L10AE
MLRLFAMIELFHSNIQNGNLEAARAAHNLVQKRAAELEVRVWRHASQIIMSGI